MLIKIKTQEEFRSDYVTIEIVADRHEVDGALSEPAAPVLYTAEQVGDFQASEAELVSAPLRRRIEELEKKLAEETQRADQNREWADRAEDRVMKDAQAHILRVRDLEAELTKAQERYARQSAAHDRVIKSLDESRALVTRLNESLDIAADSLDKSKGEVERLRGDLNKARELEAELERYRKAHVCTVECKPNQHTAFQGRQMVAALERKLIRRTEELGLVKNDRNRLAAKVRSARELLTTNEVIQARRMDGSRTGTTMSQAIESVLRALSSPEPDTSQA